MYEKVPKFQQPEAITNSTDLKLEQAPHDLRRKDGGLKKNTRTITRQSKEISEPAHLKNAETFNDATRKFIEGVVKSSRDSSKSILVAKCLSRIARQCLYAR